MKDFRRRGGSFRAPRTVNPGAAASLLSRPRRLSINLPVLRRPRVGLPNLSKFRTEKCRRHLPEGSGAYTVGCMDVMSGPSTSGVFVRMFYPTQTTNVIERQMQWPLWLPRKQYIDGYTYFKEVNKRIFGKIFSIVGGDVYVPVLWQAPLLESDTKWPVVIFTHGIGANRTTYTTFCVEMASQGFIVAAMEHRDGSASMTYCLQTISINNQDNHQQTEQQTEEDSEQEQVPLTEQGSEQEPDRQTEQVQESEREQDQQMEQDSEREKDWQTELQEQETEEEEIVRISIGGDDDDGENDGNVFDEADENEDEISSLMALPIKQLPLHRDNSFKEEWRLYEKYPVLDDFDVRNRQLHQRVDEIIGMLDFLEGLDSGKEVCNILGFRYDMSQFQGMIDTEKVSVIGHSFGGVTSIATCARDKRFKAAVALDAWMLPLDDRSCRECDTPILFMNSQTFQWKDNIKAMYAMKSDRTDRKMVTLKGTCHQAQTDFQFLVKPIIGKLMQVRYSLSPQQCISLSANGSLGFISKHLGIERESYHDDIVDGQHSSVIRDTNLDIQDEMLPDVRYPKNQIFSLTFLCALSSATES
ncbi:platelet-activating factor acetylhydrolase 2, cytoplasmic-like [Tubulanus polymorphus]|uniref:platelet-activating factor acetylhydrolase 2, cytoplasmic-like n=1 Tax=Tubulanus polymorphus TaxID=672921 RepID=UPI003DA26E55